MNATSARCGHVKRRLARREPLTGLLLQFALDAIGDGVREPGDELFDGMAEKLRAGTPLDEYELHIMLDVVLLHIRLAGLAAERRTRTAEKP